MQRLLARYIGQLCKSNAPRQSLVSVCLCRTGTVPLWWDVVDCNQSNEGCVSSLPSSEIFSDNGVSRNPHAHEGRQSSPSLFLAQMTLHLHFEIAWLMSPIAPTTNEPTRAWSNGIYISWDYGVVTAGLIQFPDGTDVDVVLLPKVKVAKDVTVIILSLEK